jgi:hypothetical protein
MKAAKRKGTDALKQVILPLAACLLALAILPHHRFGLTDVKVMALAVAFAVFAVVIVPYLWGHLVGRNNSNSN